MTSTGDIETLPGSGDVNAKSAAWSHDMDDEQMGASGSRGIKQKAEVRRASR